MINNEHSDQTSAHQQVVEYLIQVHARVARDVVQIAPSIWVIHGPIAVDGEVIMAAFNSRDAAQVAIDQLWSAEQRTTTLDGRRNLVPHVREETLTPNTGDT